MITHSYGWNQKNEQVLHFKRSKDWHSITNMSSEHVIMPKNNGIIYSSCTLKDESVPPLHDSLVHTYSEIVRLMFVIS